MAFRSRLRRRLLVVDDSMVAVVLFIGCDAVNERRKLCLLSGFKWGTIENSLSLTSSLSIILYVSLSATQENGLLL